MNLHRLGVIFDASFFLRIVRLPRRFRIIREQRKISIDRSRSRYDHTYLLSAWQLSLVLASSLSPCQTRTTLSRVPELFWWWCKSSQTRRTRFRSRHRKPSLAAAWCLHNSHPCSSCSPPTFSFSEYPFVLNLNASPEPKHAVRIVSATRVIRRKIPQIPVTLSQLSLPIPRFSNFYSATSPYPKSFDHGQSSGITVNTTKHPIEIINSDDSRTFRLDLSVYHGNPM